MSIARTILREALPTCAMMSVMIVSAAAVYETSEYIIRMFPQYALSALGLNFCMFFSWCLLARFTRGSDAKMRGRRMAARIELPPHWQAVILDIISSVRRSKWVQVSLLYALMGFFSVGAYATSAALKAFGATTLDYAIVALVAGVGGIFLLTTGFVVYQSGQTVKKSHPQICGNDLIDGKWKMHPNRERFCRIDLLAKMPRLTLVEVKANGGKLSHSQKMFLDLAPEYGFEAKVARVINGQITWIDWN